MNIREAEQQTKISRKTLRYYEEIGLVAPLRKNNGYRDYSVDEVARLRFLRRARDLGFSIEDCRSLLALWADTSRASADVKAIASDHLLNVEDKLRELNALHETLSRLVSACDGSASPECPILRDLATALPDSRGAEASAAK
jgi:MerR family transcriptional regulator, copper efflux regulator